MSMTKKEAIEELERLYRERDCIEASISRLEDRIAYNDFEK